ncbi:cupin domain-containing protein [Moorella stamsii]|uniref:cupin domain-containing protein n=1 Tax=Neomoorella stamsii TaxID=1266720 RepID=UPI001FCB1DC4|nr:MULTISPECIES: cupin domain-containing protein [Moorella]
MRFSDVPDVTPFPGIISKQVMNREKGAAAVTVGELKIDPGKKLFRHIHKVEEALVFLKGEATVEADGEEVKIDSLTVVLMPAGCKHCITNTGKDILHILYFFPAVEVERILVEE